MRIIYTIVLLLLLAIRFANAQWQQINSGLPTSSVYGLEEDGQYIYAGTSTGGVYRSSNKGDNWISVNNNLPNSNAWELYVNNDTLFAGFFGTGAFRSTDHGNSWDTLFVGSLNSYVRGFIGHNDYLFAATWGNGIFKSSDGGDNWEQVNNGLNHLTFWDIISIDDTLLAASVGGGIYKSTNNGNSWSQSNAGLTYLITYRMASLGNYVYLGTSNGGVFRSSDFGKTWTQTSLNNQTIYALLAYDTLLFAGTLGSGVLVSSNHGDNWEPFNEGNILGQIVELIHDETYIYAASLGGAAFRYNKNNITSADEVYSVAPTSFELKQNYPNPFNPTTKISWQSPVSSHQVLKVFDVLGDEVATLVNEEKPAGVYEVTFDASSLSSGTYFYRLTAGEFSATKKLIFLK